MKELVSICEFQEISYMEHVKIIDNINETSIGKMINCFKPSTHHYKKGETIITYGSDFPKMIAILDSGEAQLELINSDGDVFLLEKYEPSEVFGELFSLPLENFLYVVTAVKDCAVTYLDYNHVISPCENHCNHHSQLISNLFMMTAQKSQELSLHISILGQSSIRNKIMSYLQYIRSQEQNSINIKEISSIENTLTKDNIKNGSNYSSTFQHKISKSREEGHDKPTAENSSPLNIQPYSSFTIPVSLSDLAKYLMVDRSSMMREIKAMKEDGLIVSKNREFRILK